MQKPIILVVDDESSVLKATVESLCRHYGQKYQIVGEALWNEALALCRQWTKGEEKVALILCDQRMPGMSGIEFLQQAMELIPEAKRLLLTTYADHEMAIHAIHSGKIHYSLSKPYDPPEEKLFPVLDDLLETWKHSYIAAQEEIRVIGRRWSPRDHAVRDFLSRNRIEYKWMDPEQMPEAQELLKNHGLSDDTLPVVLFGDGTTLVQPSTQELAAKVGLRTKARESFYDLIVVGAGPAGLAAAVYAASEGLSTLIVEPDAVGGQAGSSSFIENYLGFPHGVSGDELAKRSFLQASRLGAEFLAQRVTSIQTRNGSHTARMSDGQEVRCQICLIATGVSYCKMEIPGEDRFTGAGVYYGATRAEAKACAGEEIYLVGGANSAGQSALHFARYAAKVHMLVRGGSLMECMSKYLIDQIAAAPNIVVETETEVVAISGDGHLQCLSIQTPRGKEMRAATSLFLFIGAEPKTEWLPKEIAVDECGFILAGTDLKAQAPDRWTAQREPFLMETSVPGIFVAGDVRANSVKRCAAAVGEGSIAVQFMHQYLATL